VRRGENIFALEGANETGHVLVANRAGDFLHAQITVREQVCCLLQPERGQPLAHAQTGFMLEQALQMRWAEMKLRGQIANGAETISLRTFLVIWAYPPIARLTDEIRPSRGLLRESDTETSDRHKEETLEW
jgi:hypothetical protein